jgi:Na+-driven multidrug efflux pump
MRGAGDTLTPMWISLFTTVGVRVPLAYLLVHMSKTPELPMGDRKFVFVSLLCSWLLGAAMTFAFYLKGKWKKIAFGEAMTER